jgi:hypothetical protein
MGGACFHSLQDILSFYLLHEIIKITFYKTIILFVFLRVWNLASHSKGGTQIEGILEQENERKRVTGGWRKLPGWDGLSFYYHWQSIDVNL